jgi:CheY-like chemotaxis protein
MEMRTGNGQKTTMAGEQRFENELRRVLNRLYDPLALRSSLLVDWFGLSGSPDVAQSLRRLIHESIEALKPAPGTLLTSPNYRYYQVLVYRYVQGLTHDEVAAQLALSPRQVRREQALAIDMLASLLRERFGITAGAEPGASAAGAASAQEGEEGLVADEMEWLSDAMPSRAAQVQPSLQRAISVSKSLARSRKVRVRHELAGDPAAVDIAPTVLDQLILSLLTAAIRATPGGEVKVTLSVRPGRVVVELAATPSRSSGEQELGWDEEAIAISRQLAATSGGSVEMAAGASGSVATVTLPQADKVLVLAIEDNPHTLELWQRYLEGTALKLVGVTEPEKAVAMAIALHPRAMILDVMMPGADGWMLLSQLRHHPQTSSIPVIVCTVLPQQDLALSLGAAGFIRKPATRAGFRAVLDRHIAAAARGE